MSNDPTARRLLPQNSQMGTFSFAPRPTNTAPREPKRLHCVRPNGFDSSADSQVYEPPRPQFEAPHVPDSFRQQLPLQEPQLLAHAPKPGAIYAPQTSYPDTAGLYHAVHYTEPQPVPHDLQYAAVHHPHAPHPGSPAETYTSSDYPQQDLADLLGSLKVNEAGTAPYLNNKMQPMREEEPATEDTDEYKSLLPPLTAGPGSKIRIPPELMPDDDTVLHYLDLYFVNAHPYVPVLDKSHFYQQWHDNRESLSPLLLEAIFAIAGRLADEPAQGQQWLALATRHADSFMDVPRLSTLQALMIILKAKESAPKKGYYYRSWMSIVQCVQMAKDLGLDEHLADHQAGRPCGGSPSECALKTRIWQTLFVVELMIGSPQGRTDFQVDEESVDFNVPRPIPDTDESEYHVSRNFTYLARIVRSVGRMARAYGRLKKSKEWGIDPEFVQLSPALDGWLTELPADLSVSYPPDGSPPWLPSAFIGNLHSYYYLSIILFNRPQLAFLSPSAPGGQWKHHMLLSYNAAKLLCRLQEAVMSSFGLNGLQCMQRGINFTIYAVLGCIVLHLVAITSPDPDLNSEAREFFTRHMRILERCMSAWPMPDMQKQIDSVREAFSADTRKPFVLKPSFPYGSPHSGSHPSPPGRHLETQMPHSQVSYTSHPLTPISAGPLDTKSESPVGQSLTMVSSGPGSQAPGVTQTLPLAETPAWNPSRIFHQWDTSFGAAPIQSSPPSAAAQPGTLAVGSSGSAEAPSLQDIQAVQAQLRAGTQPMATPQYSAAPVQPFVTPAMWQESVASVYEGGLKRAWDYDSHMPMKRQ
ncbi:Nitrogen assimilation transcription factor nit-4 [Madurella mycetomatis]|uniref:Nitrogen assimilation transcription factor nit-4 n=1 Tax=Madurella mycetomatis TaxID=100816 RepID=A0A175VWK8_9PEZI|nr:Nitrogen assimilation transcription factor nit-4 [Madurella mycetomatis]